MIWGSCLGAVHDLVTMFTRNNHSFNAFFVLQIAYLHIHIYPKEHTYKYPNMKLQYTIGLFRGVVRQSAEFIDKSENNETGV